MSTGNTNNPRVLVLGPTRAGWSANGKSLEETRQNAIESWTYVFDGAYRYIREITPELIQNYDIVIVNSKLYGEDNTNLLTKLAAISENRHANLKWVTSIEGPAEDYTKPDALMKRLLDSSDLVNCINKHSLSLIRSITTAKVEFIGFPYPVENISKLAVQINERTREVFICPSLLARWNDYFVAKELGLPVTGWEFRSNRKLRLLIPEFKKYKSVLRNAKSKLMKSLSNLVNPNKYIELVNKYYAGDRLAIKSNMHLNSFYETYNKYFLWLNLDDRYTWGRYVLDAAALQIPIITTKSTGHGDELFPQTCLEHEYEIEKAIELCNKLITDDEFYSQVASYPVGKLEHLKAENMKRKLLEGLGL
jgi:hypothetical protein